MICRSIARVLPSLALPALLAGCAHVAEDYHAAVKPCLDPEEQVAPVTQRTSLYFMTSRLPDCRNSHIVFGAQRGDALRYGYFERESPEDAGSPILLAREAWLTRIADDSTSPSGRAMVYVHGYNTTFDEAARRARKLRDRTGFAGPIIVFSWPSQGRLGRYMWDEENALWTQPYFDWLLTALIHREEIGEVVLVAHSMGNRIALRSLVEADRSFPVLAGQEIRTVILASPDVDRAIVERDYLGALARDGRQTTIHASRADTALRSSWAAHGYARAGDTACRLRDWGKPDSDPRCGLAATANLTLVDTSYVRGSLLGHTDFVDSSEVASDLCRVLAGREPVGRQPIGPEIPNGVFLTDEADESSPCP